MDFLKWYKNKIESANEEPPPEIWEEIQNDLDIDQVYERLEESLAKDRRKVWLWRASAAAGILLLISAGTLMLFSPQPQQEENAIAQKEEQAVEPSDSVRTIQPDLLPFDSKVARLEKQPSEEKEDIQINQNIETPGKVLVDIQESDTAQEQEQEMDENKPDLEYEFTPSGKTEFAFSEPGLTPVNSGLTEPTGLTSPLPEAKPIGEEKAFSKFTVVASGEIANTWLVNNKTLEGMDPNEFTATRPTFTSNYGFGLETNLSGRWDLVSQISLTRQQGQNYEEYIQGHYVSNNTNLEYFDVSLRARYQPFRENMYHTLSAGLYNGFLKSASQHTDGETNDITPEYTGTDFGIIAGYEYRAPLSDHLTLGTGIFLRTGLKNVFSGNEMISSNLNQSYNTSFNFSLSLGYTFSL
ncbi:MAG: PorT family protein [Marinilabilia sp.]